MAQQQTLNRVLKFGGTSVGTAERLAKVTEIIKDSYQEAQSPIAACVSAMSGTTKKDGTTSRLLRCLDATYVNDRGAIDTEIAHIRKFHKDIIQTSIKGEHNQKELFDYVEKEIDKLSFFLEALSEIEEISPRSRDRIISLGEILSGRIITGIINDSYGQEVAGFLNLNQLMDDKEYVETDNKFYEKLESNLGKLIGDTTKQYPIVVLTGYVGRIPGGIIEKIGRGYTDYTAALAAAGTKAEALEIWKEVDGIFSTDPRKVAGAHVISQISYKEAAELTYFGTEAIHPRTMGPCIRQDIPIRVKNVLNPETPGTLVNSDKKPSTKGIGKAITQKSDISIISIESDRMNEAPGFIHRMGEIFFDHQVSIDLMATSEVSVSTTVHDITPEQLKLLSQDLDKIGTVSIMEDLTSISIIGHGMQQNIGVAGRIFSIMGKNHINIILISQGASELSISFVVQKEDAANAINILHKELLEL